MNAETTDSVYWVNGKVFKYSNFLFISSAKCEFQLRY